MAIKNASAIGQAINLAAADARKHDEESNPAYIYKRYVYWTSICSAIQDSDIEMIQEVIANSDFDSLIKKLKETLS